MKISSFIGNFSLLKRTAHKQYNVQPRYYDPEKDELKGRVDSIKRRVEADKAKGIERPASYYTDNYRNIREAMERNRSQQNHMSSLIRWFFILFFVVDLVIYLQFGPYMALLVAVGAGAVFYFLRIRASRPKPGKREFTLRREED